VIPRAGLDAEVRGKILFLPPSESEPRPPGRPFRNQTLYRLSYPAPEDFVASNIIVQAITWYLPTQAPRELSEERQLVNTVARSIP
jgi:hypothetical protein